MTTTITATPRTDSATIDLRVVRDDTDNTDVVAAWSRSDSTAANAEAANWTGASTSGSVVLVDSGSARDLTVTSGQRYFVEAQYPTSGTLSAGSTALVSTREVVVESDGVQRYVAELIAPSGGFDLVGTTASVEPLYGYKVTHLDDQRLMSGPEFVSGEISSWTMDNAAPFSNKIGQWSTFGLNFTWSAPSTSATVAAGALRAYKTISTTVGREYVLTTQVQANALGTGLVIEVLNGATVVTSREVATNSTSTVRLSFTAPDSSVTFRVKNRQAFTATVGSGHSARFYVRSLSVERLPTDDLSLATYTIATLSRTDGNGVRQVRLARGADLTDGVLDATDYEPALDGLLVYTVVTERVGAPGTREIATASTRLDLEGNLFTQASTPQLRFDAKLVETYNAQNATSAVFHDVIGRADPVVSTGVQRLRSGSMRVFFQTYEDAKEAIAVAGRGTPILWRSTDNAGLDMYFIAGNVSSSPYGAQTATRHWYVDIDFREVGVPTSPLEADAAWNFGTSGERNATFFDSFNEFATFADLLNGPEVV